MKKANIFLSIILLSIISFGQSNFINWEKTYGGEYDDNAKSIISTTTGEFVIAGWTDSKGAGGKDIWVIKTNSTGEIIWEKTFGGSKDDFANCIINTPDQELLVVGVKTSETSNYQDVCLLKLDQNGKKIWEKTYFGSAKDNAYSVISVSDDGYVIVGAKETKGDHDLNIWVMKTDKKGKKIWQSTSDIRYYDDVAYSVIETEESDFIIVGWAKNIEGKKDLCLFKFDIRGNLLWKKLYGEKQHDAANKIIKTANGRRSVIVGITNSNETTTGKLWILQIDNKANIIWEKKYGNFEMEYSNCIVNTSDGGYIIAGNTISTVSGKNDLWILKLDNEGNLKWEQTFDSKKQEHASSLIKLSNDNYLLTGWTSSKGNADFWLMKFTDNPELIKNEISKFDPDKYSPDITATHSVIEENTLKPVDIDITPKQIQQVSTNTKKIAVSNSDVDINIPHTNIKNDKTFAVIIGNENYKNEIQVKYAINDAETFKEYVIKTLGVPEKQVHCLSNATYGTILGEIDWLNNICKAFKGEAKILFYYAGHGMPDQSSKSAYLLPVDGIASNSGTAIKIDDLYSKLSEYPSKSVTVFLDACFSGGSRDGMLASGRGVKIKPEENTLKDNIVVFTAVSGDQTAHPYNEKQHGLFTYYLLKKLQETKGNVDYKTLSNYISTQVSQQSVINNKEQTPKINVSNNIQYTWEKWTLK